MTQLEISSEELPDKEEDSPEFEKYVSEILNSCMNTAQANYTHTFGEAKKIWQEFLKQGGGDREDWREFYLEKYDGEDGEFSGEERREEMIEKTYRMLENFRDAMPEIDREDVVEYIDDFIKNKNFKGFDTEQLVLSTITEETGAETRISTQEDEAEGIDGYINDRPVSVKPASYRKEKGVQNIEHPIIFYSGNSEEGLEVDLSQVEDLI